MGREGVRIALRTILAININQPFQFGGIKIMKNHQVLPQLQCVELTHFESDSALRVIFHVVSFPVARSQAPLMGTVEIEKSLVACEWPGRCHSLNDINFLL